MTKKEKSTFSKELPKEDKISMPEATSENQKSGFPDINFKELLGCG